VNQKQSGIDLSLLRFFKNNLKFVIKLFTLLKFYVIYRKKHILLLLYQLYNISNFIYEFIIAVFAILHIYVHT